VTLDFGFRIWDCGFIKGVDSILRANFKMISGSHFEIGSSVTKLHFKNYKALQDSQPFRALFEVVVSYFQSKS
jgi:hypothetical protein